MVGRADAPMLMNVMTLFLARLHISFGACDDPRKKTEPHEKTSGASDALFPLVGSAGGRKPTQVTRRCKAHKKGRADRQRGSAKPKPKRKGKYNSPVPGGSAGPWQTACVRVNAPVCV